MILGILLSRFSHVWLFETPWTVARQAVCPWASPGNNTGMGFHLLLQGNLPHPWFKLMSLMSPALAGRFSTTRATWKNFSLRLKLACAQSCPTLCDSMDCSLPGSSVPGIFQARILEWVAISYSQESSWPRDLTRISCIGIGRWIPYHCVTWEGI